MSVSEPREEVLNYQAEQSVLGSMLLSNRAAEECADLLTADDFFRHAHQVLFKAFLLLMRREIPIEVLSTIDLLQSDSAIKECGGGLVDCGGEDYLLEIADYVPSPANSGYYANIVAECAAQRRFIAGGLKAVEMGYGRAPAAEMAAHAGDMMVAASAKAKAPIFTVGEIEDEDDDQPLGMSSGFKSLDNAV